MSSGDTAEFVLDADKKILSRSISLPGGVLLTIRPDARTFDHPTVRGDLSLTTDAAGKQVGPLRTYTPFGEPLKDDGTVDPTRWNDGIASFLLARGRRPGVVILPEGPCGSVNRGS